MALAQCIPFFFTQDLEIRDYAICSVAGSQALALDL